MRCAVPYRVPRASTWEPDSAQQQRQPQPQQVNPLGQTPPLLFDDGSVMTESAAVLIEPGPRHPAPGLVPVFARHWPA